MIGINDIWHAFGSHPDRAVPSAAEFDAVAVRTQDGFDEVLRSTASRDWAEDRIHPNRSGHAVIAEAYFSALEGVPKIGA
ncbi:hypothetical protein [Winogradskya humida]|uniref:GDSL-like lipase/acylhydrolase family protein n=1 Tax=Winogradskya humida TaxID=113566 RepID=A0ABQ3ZLB4_9ACTN|nr:hypothetical protein [Actinoplanes humidus]GIE19375.1 hypothetical protein Ahu01nite_024770 [Actinoplanes humidus]